MNLTQAQTLLLNHIAKQVTLSVDNQEKIFKYFEKKTVEKKELLCKQSEPCGYLYFVLSGCFINYVHDGKHQKFTLNIAVEDWWVGCLESLVTGNACKHNVQALEPSEVFGLAIENYEELLNDIPLMERFFRKQAQRSIVYLNNRLMDYLSKDATQRYLDFRDSFGPIENRVSQKIIASYLGITPEFLSTIRKRLATQSVPDSEVSA